MKHQAFIIKTQIPYSHKILLLHEKYGKIWTIFGKNHQAMQLSCGSLILCSIEKKGHQFVLDQLDIEMHISKDQLFFVHDIMRICLYALHYAVSVPEFFDFLRYAYTHMHRFSESGKQIILLRLFLMCDLLGKDQHAYRIATQDPEDCQQISSLILNNLINDCWLALDKNKLMQN